MARQLSSLLLVGLLAGGLLTTGGCSSPEEAPPTTGTLPDDLPDDPIIPDTPPALQGASPALDRAIFPAAGATAFITANERELLSAGTYNPGAYNGRSEMWDDADMAAESEPAAGAEGEAQGEAPPPEPEAEPDPSREIVEADIFKVEGDTLYVLNRYRGLVTIDISDPDHLRIAGRLPFQAQPVEMYIKDGRAYIVMSDYFVYWQYDKEADPLGFHGSQILIADVSDPANPVALGGQLIEGEITDTRMVGDVLYTVSKRNPEYWRYNTVDWEDRTWVVSLNVADPRDIRPIAGVTFKGTSNLIHVAPHAIFVAAWDPNFYLVDVNHPQETLVTYVDISEPSGNLRERGKLYVPGYIQDKFKLDWYEHTLRIMSQNGRYASSGWIHTIDTHFPDQLEILASLTIGEETWGGLRATRYAGPRAYAMTTRYEYNLRYNLNYLRVFDLSDPATPEETDVHQIDMQVTHFQVNGNQLLALGQHDPPRRENRDYKVQLGLYDVTDAAAARTLSTVKLGEGHSYTVANGDYKALKALPELDLILVPLNWWVYENNTSRQFNGTQLVDWLDNRLVERGGVEARGQVQRAFPVGDRILAVSQETVQSINALDRDRPVETSALYLQRTIFDIFDMGGYQVQLIAPSFTGGLRFEVIPFGKEDDAPALATLELPFYSAPSCFVDGSIIHMLGGEPNHSSQVIRNADFTDPLNPRLVGELDLTNEVEVIYSGGSGYYWRYWNPNAGLPLRNQLLPFTVRKVRDGADGRRDWDSWLRLVDLRDPANPRIADGQVAMNDFPFINKVTHGDILYSTHVVEAKTEAGESLLYHVKAYVDRVDVSDPDQPELLPSLNIPGWLVDASDDGELLYTVDYQWDDFGRRRNSLNILKVVGDEAVLMDVLPVGDQVNRAVFRDRLIWLTTHKYPWWGVRGDTVASRQPYTLLHRVTIGQSGTITGTTSAELQGYHFDLLDLEANNAYLASNSPYGLLVLGVADPAQPQIRQASRTIGYISRVVRHEDFLYMPLGVYGVHRAPLAALQ